MELVHLPAQTPSARYANIVYFIKTAGNGQFKAVGDSRKRSNTVFVFPKVATSCVTKSTAR
ncbi:hypothetical protein ACLK1S_04945 [Escherichia coli]